MTKVIRPAESGPVEAVIRGDPSGKKTEGGRWVGPGALSRPSMTGIQKGGTGGWGYLSWIGLNLVMNICAARLAVTRLDVGLHDRKPLRSASAGRCGGKPASRSRGDRRQELVFIGIGMDEASIRKRLDACLIEAAAYTPDAWRDMRDPFPLWEPAMENA